MNARFDAMPPSPPCEPNPSARNGTATVSDVPPAAAARAESAPLGSRPAKSATRGWRAPVAIRGSQAVHALAAVALIAQPAWWPWIAGAIVANHLMLLAGVLRPRSGLLGPNMVRLPAAAAARREVALTFDDGPDPEITPRVLDLLDRYQVRASFFCVGEKAAAFPGTVLEIARRGHSVENHSFSHPHAFAFYGPARLRREVDDTQAVIARITGRAPRFFRAPMGFRSPLLDSVLARRALCYVSWTRRGYDASRRDPAQVLRRLTRSLRAGDVLLLHDGGRTRAAGGEPLVLAVLPALLEQLAQHGLKSVALPTACANAQPSLPTPTGPG